MGDYLNKKTCEKIKDITQICKDMRSMGQRFLILEGGIAVGKTLFAKEVAKKLVEDEKNIHFFQLHEEYSYSNFVYGLQIQTEDGKLIYDKGKQPLLEIINECIPQKESQSQELHIVILDDMNRCNVNAVLGDLFTALESNEVGNVIKTDEGDISLPNNIFFIGTMNLLVGKESIDYAWFRRFTVFELKADSSYFEVNENENNEDYKLFMWFAKELFEHVRMLFEYYFADKENYCEIEKYIPGPGMFLKYNSDETFRKNIETLQNRIKQILVPLLYEYVSQGILLRYIEADLVAMSNLFGNELELNNLKEYSRSEAFSDLYDAIEKYFEHKYKNIIFLFILHSHNSILRIRIGEKSCSIIENSKYIQEYPIYEYVKKAKKQNSRPVYGESRLNVNGEVFNIIAGTAHSSMEVYSIEDNSFKVATQAEIIPSCLLVNMNNQIERTDELIKKLECVDMNNMNDMIKVMESIGVKQMILQGPPGTSKTHGAKDMISLAINGEGTLDDCKLCAKHFDRTRELETNKNVYWDMVQFHPSYSYEDFVRGITVSTEDGVSTKDGNSGQIKYKTVNKVFGDICKLASENSKKQFFLIIDEINRADIATVFGELIYALEYRGDKNKISTPYAVNNERDIYVPENLYIIGTMNTADKSVGTIDMAIRRRFLFVDMLPDVNIIEESFKSILQKSISQKKEWEQLKERTKICFTRLADIVRNSVRGNYKAKDFMIGHTYFLPKENEKNATEAEKCIKFKLKYQVLPMLREYAEDRIIDVDKITDYENLKKYLKGNDGVVDDAIKAIMPAKQESE